MTIFNNITTSITHTDGTKVGHLYVKFTSEPTSDAKIELVSFIKQKAQFLDRRDIKYTAKMLSKIFNKDSDYVIKFMFVMASLFDDCFFLGEEYGIAYIQCNTTPKGINDAILQMVGKRHITINTSVNVNINDKHKPNRAINDNSTLLVDENVTTEIFNSVGKKQKTAHGKTDARNLYSGPAKEISKGAQ